MLHQKWKKTTIDILHDRIGPSATVQVDEIINSLEINEQDISYSDYSNLLAHLCTVLSKTSQ